MIPGLNKTYFLVLFPLKKVPLLAEKVSEGLKGLNTQVTVSEANHFHNRY